MNGSAADLGAHRCTIGRALQRWSVLRLVVLTVASSVTAAQSITGYTGPTANSVPKDITAGPDGNLWSTKQVDFGLSGNEILRITPSRTFREFTTRAHQPLRLRSRPL